MLGQPVPVECLHGFRDALVQPRPMPPQDALVDRLLHQHVFEGVLGFRYRSLFVDQPLLFQLPQGRGQRLALAFTCHYRLQQAGSKHSPDDGGALQELLQVRPQSIEPAQDEALDALRHRDRLDPFPRPPSLSFAIDQSGIDQGADQLLEEERVAPGFLQDLRLDRSGQALDREQRLHQLAALLRR